MFNIPELLLVYKKKSLMDREEIKRVIAALKKKDGYLLKKDVAMALIGK